MSDLFVAGIDGGQSSTTAAIGDADGRIVGRATSAPADEVAAGPSSTRLRDALSGALDAARADAGLTGETRFAAIVAGVSGYEGVVYGALPQLPTGDLQLVHDAPVAHAGALSGLDGVTVIAGTGSVVYATGGPHAERTYGGWGYLFGDEGSALWFARETLASMMRRSDDGQPDDDDVRTLCRLFGYASLHEIARAFYAGRIGRDRLAGACPAVLQFSGAAGLIDTAALRLAQIVARAVDAGSPPVVALSGGTFGHAGFAHRVTEAIEAAVPPSRVVGPRFDPSVGALLLAYRRAGLRFPGDERLLNA